MHVEELWRFPVKSLGGERLDSARLTTDGVDGATAVCTCATATAS